ncbi:MAG: response regulator [Verrucomicrobiia bacterium]
MSITAQSRPPVAEPLVRILVADDHDLVRQGLRFMLEAQSGWIVCGEAGTAQEAINLARQLCPQVVIVDVHMPGMDGFQATREILASNPQTEVLILTLDETQEVVQAATVAGARGVVMKSDAARDLVAAVAALTRHELFFAPQAAQLMIQDAVHPLGDPPTVSDKLTRRERDVVVLVAEGRSNKEIASTLTISAKTVETHRRNIMHKLGFKSVAELVRYAVRNRLVEA